MFVGCNDYVISSGVEVANVKEFIEQVLKEETLENMKDSLRSMLDQSPLFQKDTKRMLVIYRPTDQEILERYQQRKAETLRTLIEQRKVGEEK